MKKPVKTTGAERSFYITMIALLMGAIGGVLWACTTATAQEAMQAIRGVMCDTAEDAELFAQHFLKEDKPFEDTMKLVNDKAGKMSCTAGAYVYIAQKPLKELDLAAKGKGQVTEFTVIHARVSGMTFHFPKPIAQFTVVILPKTAGVAI